MRRTLGLLVIALAACGDPTATVPPPPAAATSIRLSAWHAVLAPLERIAVAAEPRNPQGPVGAEVVWRSDAPGVASVTQSGLVEAVGIGSATISATAGSASASLVVEVAAPGLRRLVDSVRRAAGLPAMGGAIVTDTGVVAVAVAGTRRASGGPLATVTDKWHIGSNLKAVTAALAAVAVQDRALAWTSTLADLFPEHAGTMRPEYRTVTLADLLSHVGGIRNDPPLVAFAGTTAYEQRQALAAWTLAAAPVGPPGDYSYSNPGYVLAGAMIERAWTGRYEDLLDVRLLQPLGAVGLGWGAAAAAGGSDQPVAHQATSSGWAACEACDNPPGLGPAGRAHLPLGSWARLIVEFLRADQGRSTVIPAALGRDLFTPRVAIPGTDGYALGWVMVTRGWAGGRAAAHEGSNTVNHSVAWLGLGRGIGFIAVTNAADLAGGLTGRALDGLVGRMIRFHDSGQ